MKKNLILLGVLFIGFTSFAQNTNNVQLGVRGGANFATVAGDDFDSPEVNFLNQPKTKIRSPQKIYHYKKTSILL